MGAQRSALLHVGARVAQSGEAEIQRLASLFEDAYLGVQNMSRRQAFPPQDFCYPAKSQPRALQHKNLLQAINIVAPVDPPPAQIAARRQQPLILIVPQRLHRHAGATGDLAYREILRERVRHAKFLSRPGCNLLRGEEQAFF